MVYRAKVTKILSWVEANYNLNDYPLVRDAGNVYIEVDNLDEADFLESMNEKQEEILLMQVQWREKF